jgi:arabinose-5-phosphate isomerase
MLQELFELHRDYLNDFFDRVDLKASETILQAFLNCTGTIFFSGVGKSALVAKKIAVTMVSTGTRALFLSATDALHGDLGMVSDRDLFVFLSKSGESDELLNLTPYIRNKGAYLIGIVSSPNSRLAKACHLTISLPVKKELCPFDLAPTTSAAIQLIFGDVLAIALMRIKNFSLSDYALNHPAGRIGKRISLKVKDLMISGARLPACSPTAQIMNILGELSSKGCGCMVITDDQQQLLGIFTDGDLRRSLQKHGVKALEMRACDLMTKTPRTIGPDALAWEAMQRMEANQNQAIMMMPVVNPEKQVLGLIKMHDILQSGL